MWQNEQGHYLYYQRNCSNPNCLNPYCQCGENCRCNRNHQCYEGWESKPFYQQNKIILNNSMRLVWEQHVYWTRMTILSLVFNLPDINFVTARLLRNAPDMGNLMKPYYGSEIASLYSNLIREHLVIAAEIVKAAKKGDKNAVATLEKKWHENGEKVSEFLSRINPFISKDEFQKMWFIHLDLTTQEAVLMIQNNFQSSIATFDKIEEEALQMADTITIAIIKQFSKIF